MKCFSFYVNESKDGEMILWVGLLLQFNSHLTLLSYWYRSEIFDYFLAISKNENQKHTLTYISERGEKRGKEKIETKFDVNSHGWRNIDAIIVRWFIFFSSFFFLLYLSWAQPIPSSIAMRKFKIFYLKTNFRSCIFRNNLQFSDLRWQYEQLWHWSACEITQLTKWNNTQQWKQFHQWLKSNPHGW